MRAVYPQNLPVAFAAEDDLLRIKSALGPDEANYAYLVDTRIDPAPYLENSRLSVYYRKSGALEVNCVLMFYDRSDKIK